MKKTPHGLWGLTITAAGIILITSCTKSETTPNSDNTIKDIDGNIYTSVVIGTQTWMVENLKTTKYSNGDPIQVVTDGTLWNNLTTGAYCNYSNDINNASIYGRMYNWYAVSDVRKIAPAGWHVATDAEWTTLTAYLDDNIAGNKLKESGNTHWSSLNTDATNETGFTALPGGTRVSFGFGSLGLYGVWWSSTETNLSSACVRDMGYGNKNVERVVDEGKENGCSVRCVKD
jgi:uncharacterized protein (TIGR02145 family)